MSDRHNTFTLLNAIVDGGWLSCLTETQKDVWLIYLRMANVDGVAWPGASKLAELVGHADTGHIRRARRELVRLHLLEAVYPKPGQSQHAGGASTETAVFRVCIPTLDQDGPWAELAHGRNQPATPGRISLPPRADSAHQRTREETKKEPNQMEVELPFGSEVFKTAWTEWVEYRREIRKKLTPKTIQAQLRKLAAMEEEGAIASIRQSIESGWQGLFPPKQATRPAIGAGIATARAGEFEERLSL